MATTKRRTPAERVTALLTRNKALTEKEVIEQIKGADRKMVREVRRALGIDRPAAIAAARGWLERAPALAAGKVITACLNTYGIRLGPPDVSRLRPKRKKHDALRGASFKTALKPDVTGAFRCGACGVALELPKKKGAK